MHDHLGGGFSNISYFTPTWEMIQFDEYIF